MTSRKINVVNPSDKGFWRHSYILCFGAYGWTATLVYADSLDDALETAAEWLAGNAPGLIMPLYGEECSELMAGVCAERGLEWPMPEGAEPEPYWDAEREAFADLTYTESGYIPSHEWGIVAEDPTPKEIANIYHDR